MKVKIERETDMYRLGIINGNLISQYEEQIKHHKKLEIKFRKEMKELRESHTNDIELYERHVQL